MTDKGLAGMSVRIHPASRGTSANHGIRSSATIESRASERIAANILRREGGGEGICGDRSSDNDRYLYRRSPYRPHFPIARSFAISKARGTSRVKSARLPLRNEREDRSRRSAERLLALGSPRLSNRRVPQAPGSFIRRRAQVRRLSRILD